MKLITNLKEQYYNFKNINVFISKNIFVLKSRVSHCKKKKFYDTTNYQREILLLKTLYKMLLELVELILHEKVLTKEMNEILSYREIKQQKKHINKLEKHFSNGVPGKLTKKLYFYNIDDTSPPTIKNVVNWIARIKFELFKFNYLRIRYKCLLVSINRFTRDSKNQLNSSYTTKELEESISKVYSSLNDINDLKTITDKRSIINEIKYHKNIIVRLNSKHLINVILKKPEKPKKLNKNKNIKTREGGKEGGGEGKKEKGKKGKKGKKEKREKRKKKERRK